MKTIVFRFLGGFAFLRFLARLSVFVDELELIIRRFSPSPLFSEKRVKRGFDPFAETRQIGIHNQEKNERSEYDEDAVKTPAHFECVSLSVQSRYSDPEGISSVEIPDLCVLFLFVLKLRDLCLLLLLADVDSQAKDRTDSEEREHEFGEVFHLDLP
jgi:hypothetical protein